MAQYVYYSSRAKAAIQAAGHGRSGRPRHRRNRSAPVESSQQRQVTVQIRNVSGSRVRKDGSVTPRPYLQESFHSTTSDRPSILLDASILSLASKSKPRGRSQYVDHSSAHVPTTSRTPGHSRQSSETRRSGSLSRKTKSMVFLSIWLFVGVGRHAFPAQSSSEITSNQVWLAEPAIASHPAISACDISDRSQNSYQHIARRASDTDPEDEPRPPIDVKFLIGRISAWICAILYLSE